MSTDLVKSDINDAAGQIRDRIKAAFVESIPDEKWDQLIRAEIERFMSPRPIRDNFGRDKGMGPSEFTDLCREVFKEVVKKKLAEAVQEVKFETIERKVDEWLAENQSVLVDRLVYALFGRTVQGAIEMMLTRMREGRVPDPSNPGQYMNGEPDYG